MKYLSYWLFYIYNLVAFCYFSNHCLIVFIVVTVQLSIPWKRSRNDNNIYNITSKKYIYKRNAHLSVFLLETEVKNEVQDCPENDSVPGGELYIDENAEEKEQEYPDSMEKTDYGSLYGANQYYNR